MQQSNLPTIGTFIEAAGGFFGGIVRVHDVLHAVIWAPKAQGETKLPWHTDDETEIAGANSFFDSVANTVAMAEAGSPLALWAQGLEINGHCDWAIPARDVLELGYRHLKPTAQEHFGYRSGDNPSSVPAGYPYTSDASVQQTSVTVFQAGGPEAFDDTWHWSSTQYSAGYAWGQLFDYGSQGLSSKSYEGRARAVRLIQLTD